MEMVKLTINGNEIEVPAGTTILKAAEQMGIDIPTLCFLEELSSVAACRMCVVEVKGARALVASCAAAGSAGNGSADPFTGRNGSQEDDTRSNGCQPPAGLHDL